ncbi:MAG TPA: OAM dimerization domain-containing protein, partial [Verrucomicrobiae bacterium]|nr:OAM dimerization domain-containing protein [Verrucomicrobiae bacterium]
VIGGCTLCKPEKIQYIDELDEEDNAGNRLAKSRSYRQQVIKPEVEWAGDGIVQLSMFLPAPQRVAEAAALQIAKKMNLEEPEVIHKQVMHPAEGTFLEIKGRVPFEIDPDSLVIPPEEKILSADEIRQQVAGEEFRVVAATVGEDEHSVGLREIIDIKHGGIEGFGFKTHYLGTSVPISKVVDAAIETAASAILISTIITHADIHRINMRKLHDLCVEKGVRDQLILVSGGTQITNEMAKECSLDAGFGRGTKGIQVASLLVEKRRELENS